MGVQYGSQRDILGKKLKIDIFFSGCYVKKYNGGGTALDGWEHYSSKPALECRSYKHKLCTAFSKLGK